MSRIFAIDWDRNEARALVVQSGPTGSSVVGAWAARLEPAEGVTLNGKQLGFRLAEVMAGYDIGKATTIVGVGRDHVQIKLLSLPPAPDNELPALVRFQAEREFTALGSETALDYIPLSGGAETPHQVLALALSPAGLTEAREVCQATRVEPDRITVRACATLSLVHRSGVVDAGAVALVVNPLGDEADLTVLDAGQVVLMRTVRLPDAGQGPARQRTLIGEIRRTVAAARQQLSDRPIDLVLLCGNAAAVDSADGLADELGLTVRSFDPAAYAPSGLASHGVAAESLSRFSAVLGMALAEADRRRPIVDFLNVRRPAEKQRFGRVHALAAAAAAVVVLFLGGVLWAKQHKVSKELEALRAEIKQKTPIKEANEPRLKQWEALSGWNSTGINWLETITTIGQRIRPKALPKGRNAWQIYQEQGFDEEKDIVLKQVLMQRAEGPDAKGGEIRVQQGAAKSSEAVYAMMERLRKDSGLRVIPGIIKGSGSSVPGYPAVFDMRIILPAPEDVAEAPPETKPDSAAPEGAEKAQDADQAEGEPATATAAAGQNNADATN
jgi:Tfp pilus assembly PilM family ATPase